MLTKSLLGLKKVSLVFAIGWTLIIAFLCLVKVNDFPSIGISITSVDKYVHITFHFVFTMLWGFYSWEKQGVIEIKNIRNIFLISVGYGILIEFLQEEFTTTRHADIMDVAANTIGALMALGVFLYLNKKKQNE
ncbi:VanZ family protein [Flavobacterium sp. N1994]|uniref:VanZ family protein n=1 Tax=Flavobacterium sp. N1994 TaxID=2986827 RepID=UPI00222191BA|nr:VanZ family protein [Flavobacterium sp. N1994]